MNAKNSEVKSNRDTATRSAADDTDSITVFETLEAAFWWVAAGPAPLTIHPRGFADLPGRSLTLYQLRIRLASASVSPESRAAIWSYLVRQARISSPQQPDWTIAAAGLALPELIRIVQSLTGTDGASCDVADLEAAALGAFYHELRRTDLPNTRDPLLRRRLLMAAYRAARTLRDTTISRRTDNAIEDNPKATKQENEQKVALRRPHHTDHLLKQARRRAQQDRVTRQRAGDANSGQVRP